MKKLILFFSLLFSRMIGYYKIAMNKAKPFLQKELPAAIRIVELLKTVIDNPGMDLLTAVIPGKFDDLVLSGSRNILPVVLLNMGIAYNIGQGKTNDEIITAVIEQLRKLKLIDKSKYGKTLLDIAAELSHALVDGKISLSELASLIHGMYESEFKPQQLKAAA